MALLTANYLRLKYHLEVLWLYRPVCGKRHFFVFVEYSASEGIIYRRLNTNGYIPTTRYQRLNKLRFYDCGCFRRYHMLSWRGLTFTECLSCFACLLVFCFIYVGRMIRFRWRASLQSRPARPFRWGCGAARSVPTSTRST